ncbi:MAG: hypothetical protein LJE68_18750 [Rhodobacter sp.]|nr:hypothetical protein [Rhodobacter sp.]
MTENAKFTATLIAALFAAWLLSGDRFLDLVFEMVDLGRLDDIVIEGAVILEDAKANLGLPDIFAALRGVLHWVLGV